MQRRRRVPQPARYEHVVQLLVVRLLGMVPPLESKQAHYRHNLAPATVEAALPSLHNPCACVWCDRLDPVRAPRLEIVTIPKPHRDAAGQQQLDFGRLDRRWLNERRLVSVPLPVGGRPSDSPMSR